MNSESSNDKSFIPIVLVTLSIIVAFGWQVQRISQDRDNLQANKQKLEEFAQTTLPKLEDQVLKAKQIQAGLEKLVLDLLEAAKTDPDAKAIVTKYNIKQEAPASGAAPAPR